MRRLLVLTLVLAACSTSGLGDFGTTSITLDGRELTVAVADSTEERRQGLQNADQMPGDLDGVLFVYDAPVLVTFHMRNVGFPLDIWLFDAEGRLFGSTRMEPCPGDDCTHYGSPGPIMWALETTAGEFDFGPGSTLEVDL